jgi:hypothetical protein
VESDSALIGGIGIRFIGAHRLQNGFVAHQATQDDFALGQIALHIAFLRRHADHLAKQVAEFVDVVQMVAPEFAQPIVELCFLQPIDRRLIGIGRVVIELDQILQKTLEGRFSANGRDRGFSFAGYFVKPHSITSPKSTARPGFHSNNGKI